MVRRIVAKFGGSSVKNATALKQVATIIQRSRPLLVVISATYNTTNELEQLAKVASLKGDLGPLLDKIESKHLEIVCDLNILDDTQIKIKKLLSEARQLCSQGELSLKSMDCLYCIGERLSSVILYKYLKGQGLDCEYLDAREFILTDSLFSRANPNFDKIKGSCERLLSENNKKTFITQGFIGSNEKNETTTLGREGSDYSAVLFAEALGADEVTIWTDVAGVASFDPKKCKIKSFLENLSYDQAELLAENGAKVLFAQTLAPVKKMNIPLYVKSTFAPEELGTCISHVEMVSTERPVGMAIEDDILTVVGGDSQWIRGRVKLPELEYTEKYIKFKLEKKDALSQIYQLLFEI